MAEEKQVGRAWSMVDAMRSPLLHTIAGIQSKTLRLLELAFPAAERGTLLLWMLPALRRWQIASGIGKVLDSTQGP